MIFYTDGAYSPTRDCGGWAWYCPDLNIKVCNFTKETTNNRMELTAVIEVLKFIKLTNIQSATVFSDSMYVIGTVNQNWNTTTNQDLWAKFFELYSGLKNIKLEYCKGHSDVVGNNICDTLAVKMSNYGNN